jgi:hypothetical protein
MKVRLIILCEWVLLMLSSIWAINNVFNQNEISLFTMFGITSTIIVMLCIPLIAYARYRNYKFIAYCIISVLIGSFVAQAWWLGIAAWWGSLLLSIPALIIDDTVHSWLFAKRQGHGLWILLALHLAMLLLAGTPVFDILQIGQESALFVGIWFPVTIWRCVSTMLCVSNLPFPNSRPVHSPRWPSAPSNEPMVPRSSAPSMPEAQPPNTSNHENPAHTHHALRKPPANHVLD